MNFVQETTGVTGRSLRTIIQQPWLLDAVHAKLNSLLDAAVH